MHDLMPFHQNNADDPTPSSMPEHTGTETYPEPWETPAGITTADKENVINVFIFVVDILLVLLSCEAPLL